MKRTQRAAGAATLLLTILIMTFGCKNTPDPGTSNLTSVQGSWKITGLTVDPALIYMGLPITDLASGLQVLGENCLKDAVITFNANGTITNNVATQTSCTTAVNTQRIISMFFGTTTTYTEANSQLTLKAPTQTVTATATEVFGPTTATLTTKMATDPLGNPVATTYTVVLTKQ